jgi:hypothetical protein
MLQCMHQLTLRTTTEETTGLLMHMQEVDAYAPTGERQDDTSHAGRLADMDSPLGAPGGLGGSLLVQLCIQGAQRAFTWFQGSV